MLNLDKKILLGGVAVAIIAIVFVVALLPSSDLIKNIIHQNPDMPLALTTTTTPIKPISILYNGTSILNATERDAQIRTNFYVTNSNTATVILESITYDIAADGLVIGHGQIGQRYEGSWESSYYYPLVTGVPSNLGNTAVIQNTGNYPNVWAALQDGKAKFTISGNAYYATNTAVSGGEYNETFNFTD